MRRFVILGFYLLAATVIFTKFSFASENGFEMHVPMGTLVLEPPSSVEPKRANVSFPHSKHFAKVSCITCHHKWSGINQITGCMTSGCHDSNENINLGSEKKRNKSDIELKYYKKAFHNQCIGCHKIMKKQAKKIEQSMINLNKTIMTTGPTGCIECHPK